MEAKLTQPTAADIKKQVKGGKRSPWTWAVLSGIVAAALFGFYFYSRSDDSLVSYRTAKVERGDIVTQAAATGTLEPVRTVSVGAEISGRIATVAVDENDEVKVDQILATFDKTTLESQLKLAKARLASANALIRGALASRKAAALDLERTKTLASNGVVSQADLDAVLTAEMRARSALDQSRADAAQAQANLDQVALTLDKAVILSPIDGVVLTRSVEPGQTVAASLQAPELFVVAEDLSKMILRIWVDEADIGVVRPGQKATFDVSAWPNKEFEATVEKLSLSPTTTNNVVTYAAELAVDNSEGLLRPGMTANANVITGIREDVLKVPNAALRFSPATKDDAAGSPLMMAPRPRSRASSNATSTSVGRVYVLRNGKPDEVEVKTGRSDGRFTEIESGLSPGDEVIVGLQLAAGGSK